MNTTEDYYRLTNQGLDIILALFPDAERGTREKGFKFSIRDEKTPSATLWLHDKKKVWHVTDFGDKMYSPIDLVMREHNLDFKGACRWIEMTFNIASEYNAAPRNSKYSQAPATEEHSVGEKYWAIKEKPLMADVKGLFSKYVWSHLQSKNHKDNENLDEHAYKEGLKLMERYNLFVLESTSKVGIDKTTGKKIVHTFHSTETYPIYMYNEGGWQKFYEPYSQKQRFSSNGEKPKDYVFGMQRISKLYADAGEQKLQDIVICTGGSDAINVAALGYEVIWFNSETVAPSTVPFHKLLKFAHRIYNLPDIDATGKKKAFELSMYHLGIYTIYLPESLKLLKTGSRDSENNPKFCKDVRDFFNHYGSEDFRNILKTAYPMQFWSESISMDSKGNPKMLDGLPVMKYSPKPKQLLNFLYRNGFCRIKDSADNYQFVRIDGNVVKSVNPDDIKAFVDSFLDDIHAESDLYDAFIRSKDLSESTFARLPRLELEFRDHDRETQYMFFENSVWEIKEQGIRAMKPASCSRFVWEHEVIAPKLLDEKGNEFTFDFSLQEPQFDVFVDENGEYGIEVKRKDSMFLNFLINTSRVYWREELEIRIDKLENKEQYKLDNQFEISGALLSKEEQKEQQLHLIAKLAGLGYMLHRYKDETNSFCLWSMDYVMKDTDKSQGGTGKSVFGKSLFPLMQYETLDGRNSKLTGNPHIYENVTEHTDYLLVDDGAKYLDFSFFFSLVTTFMKVNPKGKSSFTIPFAKSPKLHISSNFPPMDADESTLRRIWFLAFSDYYHFNTSGEYREVRRPSDEFGKNLIQHFDKEEWNTFLNFLSQCVQVYMKYGKVEPPMGELMVNTFRSKLGANFIQWANFYFDEETTNSYVPRYKMFETYKIDINSDMTANTFKDKLQLYCRMRNWTLNPKDVAHIQQDGRISIKMKEKEVYNRAIGGWQVQELPKAQSIEHFYIQTGDTPLRAYKSEEKLEIDSPKMPEARGNETLGF